jgi:hypothetical protein
MTPDVWVTLYSGIAKMNGVVMTDAEVRRAFTPMPHTGTESAFEALTAKIKAPFVDTGYVYGIDFADIDNDGQKEYVLWWISSGFLRDSVIAGVYRPQPGGTMVSVPVPTVPASHTSGPAMFDTPFLSLDGEGVTMRYIEGQNGARKRTRYLWKGEVVRALDVVPCTRPGCDTPTHF